MSFTRGPLTLFLIVAVVSGFLFYKGYKTPVGGSDASDTHDHAAHAFEMGEYMDERKQELPGPVRERINALEKDEKSKTGLENLIVLWDSLNNQLISAHYMTMYAELEPTEKNWFAAGSKFYTFASLSHDSIMMNEAAGKAKHAFEKVLALNASNLDAQTALAAIYIQVDQDVMKGVGLLKEVVEKDSNNIQAIFTLGMLSIQSGQFDKAEERFQKLISIQPFNPEYYFYLGEVYAKAGDTQKAIKTYETCKTLLKDEAAKKEIESLINKLKNI
jgi:tetratricopeptide (TPR) repeat protein